MQDLPQLPVLVLAAGAGARLGGDEPKPLAQVAGRSLLEWTLHMLDAEAHRLTPYVVVRQGQAADAVATEARRLGAAVVVAPNAERGIAWSLAAGLGGVDCERGVVVALADDPLATLALPSVLAGAHKHPDHVVAVGRRDAAPHPVFLPPDVAREFAPPTDEDAADTGIRTLLHRGGRLTLVAPPPGTPQPFDVDTAEDLLRLGEALRVR